MSVGSVEMYHPHDAARSSSAELRGAAPIPAAITPKSEYLSLLETVAAESVIPPAPGEYEVSPIPAAGFYLSIRRPKKGPNARKNAEDSDEPPTAPVPTTIIEPNSIRRNPSRVRVDVRDAKPTPSLRRPGCNAPATGWARSSASRRMLQLRHARRLMGAISVARTLPSGGIPTSFTAASIRTGDSSLCPGNGVCRCHTRRAYCPHVALFFHRPAICSSFLYAHGFLNTWNITTSARRWLASLDHRDCVDILVFPRWSMFLAIRSPENYSLSIGKTGAILRQTSLEAPIRQDLPGLRMASSPRANPTARSYFSIATISPTSDTSITFLPATESLRSNFARWQFGSFRGQGTGHVAIDGPCRGNARSRIHARSAPSSRHRPRFCLPTGSNARRFGFERWYDCRF